MTAAAPALGYSIVANLDGKRQITAQYFVAGDEDMAAIHANVDRTMRVIDRQVARYEIEEKAEDLAKLRNTLAQAEEDLARVDHDFEVKKATLNVQIETVNGDYKAAYDADYDKFVKKGYTGSYSPQGSVAANLSRHKAEVTRLAAERDKAQAERDQHRSNVMISIDRFKKGIAEAQAAVDKREALIKGE